MLREAAVRRRKSAQDTWFCWMKGPPGGGVRGHALAHLADVVHIHVGQLAVAQGVVQRAVLDAMQHPVHVLRHHAA